MAEPDYLPNIAPGEMPYYGKEINKSKFLRLGYISRVDYETGYVDITWLDAIGSSPFATLPLTFGSARSSIRGMPEEGCLVYCSWSRQTQTWEEPCIVSYKESNLKDLLEYRLLRTAKTPDQLKVIQTIREKLGYNVTRGKRRKIYPGEIQIESSPGAELYLDEDVYLSDSKLNEIEIRSADRSIRLSCNQIYTSTQASRTWNGMVIREPGDLEPAFQPTVLSNGQKIQIVTDNNNPIHLGGRAFTEHRTQLYELSDGILKATEVNSGYDVKQRAPYISFVLGTLVGNDKDDTSKYTKVLRPQVFSSAVASEFLLDYLECMPEEYKTLASTMHFRHYSRAQIDLDKEGHLFTFFPSSSGGHPLGAGRSWEAGFEGSVKLVIGAETSENKSLFLDTKGGIKATIGYDKQGFSSYVVSQKGIHLEVMAPANDGNAYFLKTTGNVLNAIDGNYNLEVTGDYTLSVRGKVKIESLATREDNYINDKNNVYGGAYKKIVVKDKQEQIGYNRTTQITGNLERAPGVFSPALTDEVSDKYSLTTGSREETFTNGNIKRTLLFGNIENSLTKGDIKNFILLGNHLTEVTTGNIEQKVITGDIKREVITKSSVGMSDKLTTGNHEIYVTTGDIKREVVTKTSVGITDKITTGSHTTTVVTGDITRKVTTKNSVGFKDEIKVGDHSTVVTTGNIKEELKLGDSTEAIVTGSKKITIKTGDFKVTITAGNIDVSTKAGKIKLNSKSQTVDISGMLTVTVKSGVKLKLSGPQVEIGQLPTRGGVVTGIPGAFTHLDYLTGTPLIGSKTVKASI